MYRSSIYVTTVGTFTQNYSHTLSSHHGEWEFRVHWVIILHPFFISFLRISVPLYLYTFTLYFELYCNKLCYSFQSFTWVLLNCCLIRHLHCLPWELIRGVASTPWTEIEKQSSIDCICLLDNNHRKQIGTLRGLSEKKKSGVEKNYHSPIAHMQLHSGIVVSNMPWASSSSSKEGTNEVENNNARTTKPVLAHVSQNIENNTISPHTSVLPLLLQLYGPCMACPWSIHPQGLFP